MRNAIRLLVSLATSVLVLALMFKLFTEGSDDVSPSELFAVMQNTVLILLVPYALLTLTQGVFRAIRYRLLIKADGSSETPSFRHTLEVTLVRNMLVDLLPARSGELSYVAMMNRGCNVAADTCLSSLGVSFVFDIIALGFIVGAVLLWQLLTSDTEGWMLTAGVAMAVLSLVMVIGLFFGVQWMAWIVRRLPLGRLGDKLASFLDKIAESISTARKGGVAWKTLGLSVLVRLGKYGGLYCLFKAVTVPSFTALSGAAPAEVVGAFIAAEGAASLPVPGFMSFGSYEAGGAMALTLLNFTKAESIVAMLAIHVWSQAFDYSLGGLAAVLFTFRKRAAATAETDAASSVMARRKLIVGALAGMALLAAGGAFLFLQMRRIKKMGGLRPPSAGESVDLSDADRQARSAAIQPLNGMLVWSSNRGGNHDIYGMQLPSGEIRQLTRHPHTEYFARLSPDGRQMAFCRSQEPWVSQRNYVAWDVYVLDLQSGQEFCVATNANTPVWAKGGSRLVYQKSGNSVVAYDIKARAEVEVLIAAGRDAGLPERVMFETPSYGDRYDALALTLRRGVRGTMVWADGELRKAGGGCELVWGGTGEYMLYVDKGGKQKNAIYRVAWPSLERTMLLDLPGDFSHEYFPREDHTGRYLVLGASQGGHEHDKADYEIFLWQIGAPADQAVRMTFHTGNDCWPDLWLKN